jgi:hypothetical protein
MFFMQKQRRNSNKDKGREGSEKKYEKVENVLHTCRCCPVAYHRRCLWFRLRCVCVHGGGGGGGGYRYVEGAKIEV